MYKKILVPLDGSELAEVALPYAEEMAGRLGSKITLISVLTSGSESAEGQNHHLHQFYIQKMVEVTKHGAERYLEKPGEKAIKVESAVLVGHPAEQIVHYADKEDIDLIVMATHGRSGIKRWALGSMVDKVLRASKVPVWLVRAGIAKETVYDKGPTRTILVPLDGSELAEAVLPHVEALAKQWGAENVEIVLVGVCEPVFIPAPVSMEEYVKNAMAVYRERNEQYLAGVEKRLKDIGLRVRSEMLVGKPADEIVEYASKNPFNLIVMATHGSSGIGRWVFGSAMERVLRTVNTPLLLVRAPGASTE